MKRYLAVVFLMTLFSTGLANQAFAGYCYVTVESDSTSTNSSLRSKIEKYVNAGDASSCSLIYLDGDEYEYVNDYQIFKLGSDTGDTAQGIIFETPELGGSVRAITLDDQISIGATAPLVIGNHSLDTFTDSANELSEITGVDSFSGEFLVDLGYVDAVESSKSSGGIGAIGSFTPGDYSILGAGNNSGLTFYGYYTSPEEDSDTGEFDYSGTYLAVEFKDDWNKTSETLYNYGTVIIDASDVEDKPFVCQSGSSYVFLRDLVILTSTYEQDDLFSDDSESSCLKNGGNVSVCSAAGLNQEVYDAWVDDGSANGADLPSDWCSDSNTPPGIHINPGDQNFPWLDLSVWYEDGDGDGYGDAESKKRAETQPDGYVANDDDCDDSKPEIHPDAAEVCGDDADNNCDGLTDCEDGSCSADVSCLDAEIDCSDGADNDSDGTYDCDDSDCETNADCTGTGSESACDDGLDNDADGASDCDDSDCASDAACTLDPEIDCSDDTDNDGDGSEDCSDTDCYYDEACDDQVETSCTDYIDNDGDSAVDCEDADCAVDSSCADNDGDADGFTPSENDCDDTKPEINPGADEICLDDVDNNCDGVTDETTTCINLQIGDDPEGGQQLAGGAGCGCYIGSNSDAASEQLILALLASLPLVAGFTLRARAATREQSSFTP